MLIWIFIEHRMKLFRGPSTPVLLAIISPRKTRKQETCMISSWVLNHWAHLCTRVLKLSCSPLLATVSTAPLIAPTSKFRGLMLVRATLPLLLLSPLFRATFSPFSPSCSNKLQPECPLSQPCYKALSATYCIRHMQCQSLWHTSQRQMIIRSVDYVYFNRAATVHFYLSVCIVLGLKLCAYSTEHMEKQVSLTGCLLVPEGFWDDSSPPAQAPHSREKKPGLLSLSSGIWLAFSWKALTWACQHLPWSQLCWWMYK